MVDVSRHTALVKGDDLDSNVCQPHTQEMQPD
jgi:hypothetical protein